MCHHLLFDETITLCARKKFCTCGSDESQSKSELCSQPRTLAKRKVGPGQLTELPSFRQKGSWDWEEKTSATDNSILTSSNPQAYDTPVSCLRYTNTLLMSLVSNSQCQGSRVPGSDRFEHYLAFPQPAGSPHPLGSSAVLFLVCYVNRNPWRDGARGKSLEVRC